MDTSPGTMAGIEVASYPQLAAAQAALNLHHSTASSPSATGDQQHQHQHQEQQQQQEAGPSSASASIPPPPPHFSLQNGDGGGGGGGGEGDPNASISFASSADVTMADHSLSPDDSNGALGKARKQNRRTIRKACDLCHSTKVKCILPSPLQQPSIGAHGNILTNSGPYHRPHQPCQRCIKLGKECVFTPLVKRKSRSRKLETGDIPWFTAQSVDSSSSSSSAIRPPQQPFASSSSNTLPPASALTSAETSAAGRSLAGSDWDVFGALFGFDPLFTSSSGTSAPTAIQSTPASAEEVAQFLASFDAAPWSAELQNLQEDVCVHTAEQQQGGQHHQHPGMIAPPPDASVTAADASALTEASAFFAQHSNHLLQPPPPPAPASAPTTAAESHTLDHCSILPSHPGLDSDPPAASTASTSLSIPPGLQQAWFAASEQPDESLATHYAPSPVPAHIPDPTPAPTNNAQTAPADAASTAALEDTASRQALEAVMADTIKRIQDLLERERSARQKAEKRANTVLSNNHSGAVEAADDHGDEEGEGIDGEGQKKPVSAGLRTLALAIRVVERATAWPADMDPCTQSNGSLGAQAGKAKEISNGKEDLPSASGSDGPSSSTQNNDSGTHTFGALHSHSSTTSPISFTPAFAMLLFALGMQVLQALEDLSYPLPSHLPPYQSPLRALPELAIYAPHPTTMQAIRSTLVKEQAAQMGVCMERLVKVTEARHVGQGPCLTRMIAKKLGEVCGRVASG
ncbi:hypothetical protein A4X09_0g3146 [Tilletia walkeri]|uniref:Zn(2)-C6 fungal-type domain-containing protein n=1 Tax=Tilletia walkeri TaxID=117179 RepID=A0A8X7T5V6_9BASI|nr:hypothetical protein A4X09_0g3146 [Tilletia walkeri]